ncbi:MAG: gliding motility-associated C-terminal domain-containing protein [Bacteroidales bacterium]|nr:gliding motility-associated C-terminal domain-containing protein [Bacteroidales bacterium]
MKRIGIIALLMCLVFVTSAEARTERDTLSAGPSISFTENRGQWESDVFFAAQLHNAAIFVERQGFVVTLREAQQGLNSHQMGTHRHAFRVAFDGGNKWSSPSGYEPEQGYSNYFIGPDPARWATGVSSFAAVEFGNIYDGVDFRIFSAKNMVKYEFRVAPEADPSVIKLSYDGQSSLRLAPNGNLIIGTTVRDVVELRPYVYQQNNRGKQVEVKSSFRLKNNVLTFEIGDYDHSLPLVIDPVLYFSTYTGSTADNWGTASAYDSHQNVYTAGLVFAEDYPTTVGAYDVDFNGQADIGIFKFNSTGDRRLYATYLGGSGTDMPHSIFVNSFDELLIFGTTGSTNFPTTSDAYSRTHSGGQNFSYLFSSMSFPNGSDFFISRLSSDGTSLQASTYIGGSGNDGLNYKPYFTYASSQQTIYVGNDSLYYNYSDGARGEIITDDQNNVYVGSTTFSTDFPTTRGAVREYCCGKQDGVVFKLDYNLRNMLWSTYIGGSGDDAVYSIDVDNEYNLLICGGTNSTNFPLSPGTFQSTYGGGSADGFIAKLSYYGDRLLASTYFGSTEYDQCYFVRNGKNDEVLIFGQTAATGSTMIFNAAYNTPSAGMLLARFNSTLTERRWSTVFGTPYRINLSPTAFCADICNRIYAVGWGRDFVGHVPGVGWGQAGTAGMEVTADAYQSTTDGQDFYIISLSSDASTLDYASFFGEPHTGNRNDGADHVDGGTSRFDKLGTLYQSVCASCGGSNGFPVTPGVWSESNNSNNCNNAIFRFSVHNDFPVAEYIIPPVGCAPYTISFVNTGRGTSFHWDFGDGTTSTQESPSHTYTDPGKYKVTLVAAMADGCTTADTVMHEVTVLGSLAYSHEELIACSGSALQLGSKPLTGCAYAWTGGSVSDPSVANPWVTTTGTYVLRTSVASGCSQTDTFRVNFVALVDTIIAKAPSCPSNMDGEIALHLTDDGVGSAITFDGLATTDTLFAGLASGSVHIVELENGNCRLNRTITVPQPPVTHFDKESNSVLCSDSCLGWFHVWDGITNDTMLANLCPGNYEVTLTDTNNCPYTHAVTIRRSHDLDGLRAWADSYNLFLGTSTRLHATDISGATYLWSPATSLNNPTVQSPVATPTDSVTVYTVTVTSADGCTAFDTVCLRGTEVVCGAPNFVIPNAFTPNSDGRNDRLCFNGEYITSFYIAIFTRWGEKVYESHDINECWDGRYHDNWCLPGVYTYTCTITCEAGLTNSFKGDITLIR